MIANYTEKGWQLITQRSHGLLAAQICAQWHHRHRPRFWIETLIATAEHDDVFNELENKNLIDANGAPLNFKATTFEKDKSQRLIDMAQTKCAYIALLQSRHLHFVHGKDPGAQTFLKRLGKSERNWLKTAGTTPDEVDHSYQLLEFCDAFSLLLCQQLIQPEGRRIQIGTGPDQRSYDLFQNGDQLHVSPWPFEEDRFEVSYESRTLSQLSFSSSKALKSAIQKADTNTHRLNISKP